jgi:DNA-binding transcriptional LysR family regulator
MLNLYKLEIFVQVVEEGSFSAAAARRLMTQSGVSQHVQDLERSLGVALFVRRARGVQLTAAGVTLYEYTRRLFALAAEAEAAVTDVGRLPDGQVNMGATPGVGVYVLAEWVHRFAGRYPNLAVNVQTAITARIVEGLFEQQLDLGFIEGELSAAAAARLEVRTLETIEQMVVVGPHHPFWNCTAVELAELNGQRFIMRQRESQTRIWLDAQLAQAGVRPQVVAEFDNVESIKRAVMAGPSLTILPGYAFQDEVAFGTLRGLPIAGSPLQRTLKLIWDRRRFLSPVARAFLRHVAGRFPAISREI